MVKLGEVFWVASVKGGDDAADTASGLQDNLEGVAESAVGAASAQNDYGGQVEENTKRTEEANRWTSKLDSSTGLLGSALFFAADMFGVAGVATTLYEGALALADEGDRPPHRVEYHPLRGFGNRLRGGYDRVGGYRRTRGVSGGAVLSRSRGRTPRI